MSEPTTNTDVLYAIGLGVSQLRTLVSEAERSRDGNIEYAAERERSYQQERQRTRQLESDLLTAKASADRYRKQAQELAADRDATEAKALRRLDQYDRLTLALSVYIEELTAHRDDEKTKSTKIALGHIVERLKDIYATKETAA